jgi:hypothetical protein
MAALVLASIPSHINTYERLLAYAAMALEDVANDAKINVQQGQPSQQVCSVSVSTTADGVKRFIVAAYIPVDTVVLTGVEEKQWMAANDISTAPPHIVFTSN